MAELRNEGSGQQAVGTDRAKAKAQARRLVSVAGSACTLHVGFFTYFQDNAVRFHWIDPPSEPKKPIKVPEIGDAWRYYYYYYYYYYEPARALWRDAPGSKDKQDGELVIPVPELDLKLRVHSLLAPMFTNRIWEEAQRAMFKAEDQLKKDGFEAYGLKVECGLSWSERVGPERQPVPV